MILLLKLLHPSLNLFCDNAPTTFWELKTALKFLAFIPIVAAIVLLLLAIVALILLTLVQLMLLAYYVCWKKFQNRDCTVAELYARSPVFVALMNCYYSPMAIYEYVTPPQRRRPLPRKKVAAGLLRDAGRNPTSSDVLFGRVH